MGGHYALSCYNPHSRSPGETTYTFNDHTPKNDLIVRTAIPVPSIPLAILIKTKLRQHNRIPESIWVQFDAGNNEDMAKKYQLWGNGINFITKRKITIHGDVHHKIGNIFWYDASEADSRVCKLRRASYQNMIEIVDKKAYRDKTAEKQKKYFTQVNAANKKNLKIYQQQIREYNIAVQDLQPIVDKIKCLNQKIENLSWHQHIIYDGVKYGIPCVTNGYHRENDCGRLITKILVGKHTWHLLYGILSTPKNAIPAKKS